MATKVSRRAIAEAITTKLLSEPAKQQHWMQVLAAYLVAHDMVNDADMLINDIAHELLVQSGQLVVEVTSAEKLGEAVRKELVTYLQRETDAKNVQLHESTDPELIGGLVARTADTELDISLRSQLRQLTAIA
ncbi:MAG: F0F1 ATP synthase subunit delta [Candidatus Saccharimonadales bacterium]